MISLLDWIHKRSKALGDENIKMGDVVLIHSENYEKVGFQVEYKHASQINKVTSEL